MCKACTIGDYFDIKNCSFKKKKCFDKLVLTYEDEILNTTEMRSTADKM